MIHRSILLILLLFSIVTCNAQDSLMVKSLPKTIGWVSDFDSLLSPLEEKGLATIIENHALEFGDQIAIVTVHSIHPYESLYDYSLALANKWGVGEEDKNNGIVVAIWKIGRKVEIRAGDGVLSRLTNEETKKIIEEIMKPQFKQGQYYEGLRSSLDAIVNELE